MASIRLTRADLTDHAFAYATDAQRETLARMEKFGWKVTKVLGRRGQDSSISLAARGQAVWLKPDGSVVRPEQGKTRARIKV